MSHYGFCVPPPAGERSPVLLTATDGFAAGSPACGSWGSQLGGKTKSRLSPGFAELFAPGESMVIFLICSERERKKGPSIVAGPRECLMPLTAINFSRHSTAYKWWCLLRWHKPCLNFGLFILKHVFILFSWLKTVPFCWSILIYTGSKYNTFWVWVSGFASWRQPGGKKFALLSRRCPSLWSSLWMSSMVMQTYSSNILPEFLLLAYF